MANTFKRKLQQNIGTTVTTVGGYTVPAATQVTVIGLTVSNITAVNIVVEVSVYSGAIDYFIVKNCPVPVGGTVVLVGGDQKIVLETGDAIRVKSDTATSADCIMSILEIT